MAPEKSPAFQFYPKEFLMDGNVAAMSLQERGAYITLLCICWQERSLPVDLKRLANIVGLPLKAFQKLWPSLFPCFVQQGDRLLHPRLEKEREKQEQHRQRQSDKGRASAESRANRGATEPQPEGNRKSTTVQPEPQPTPNSPVSDLRSPKKEKTSPAEKAPGGVREFLTWFQSEYATRRNGATYFIRWEAHGAIVKRLLTAFSIDRLKKHAQLLLTTDEDWTTGTDRGVEILSAKINWLEERLCAWEAKRRAREAV